MTRSSTKSPVVSILNWIRRPGSKNTKSTWPGVIRGWTVVARTTLAGSSLLGKMKTSVMSEPIRATFSRVSPWSDARRGAGRDQGQGGQHRGEEVRPPPAATPRAEAEEAEGPDAGQGQRARFRDGRGHQAGAFDDIPRVVDPDHRERHQGGAEQRGVRQLPRRPRPDVERRVGGLEEEQAVERRTRRPSRRARRAIGSAKPDTPRASVEAPIVLAGETVRSYM